VTDGERIVSYFGSCGLVCYDLAGKQLWKLEMPPATIAANFGSGVSPILSDGTVVLVRDEMTDPKIVAVDAATGSLRWQKTRHSRTSYCTPVIWDTPAGKQIAAAGHARMIGYDLRSGAEAWSVGGVPSSCCPSPVTADGLLFFAGWSPGGSDEPEMQMPTYDSLLKDLDTDKDGALNRAEAEKMFEGFFDSQDANKDGKITRDEWDAIVKFMKEGKNSAFALKPGGKGDVTKSHVLWTKTKGLPYVSSALVYRGQYLMVKDGGIVTAYDTKTGREIYQERTVAPGKYYASPIAANGAIYFTSLENGAITVLKGGAERPEVLATNPALGERTAPTPALADNRLYVRTAKHLYAFENKGTSSKE
jgi:outer membrane protein assembly factor BamB